MGGFPFSLALKGPIQLQLALSVSIPTGAKYDVVLDALWKGLEWNGCDWEVLWNIMISNERAPLAKVNNEGSS